MSKKHNTAPASAPATLAITPPLPARFDEILAALPVPAWVENSKGEILAHNRALAGCDQKSCQRAFDFRVARASHIILYLFALAVLLVARLRRR